MAILSDIKKMQDEGKTTQEIISSLKEQGVSPREISEALAQAKIKEAVIGEKEGYEASPQAAQYAETKPAQAEEQPEITAPSPSSSTEMTRSLVAPRAEEAPQPAYEEAQYTPAQPSYQEYGQYPQYPQQPAPSMSPDIITEISEQVVAEKLSPLRRDIEKVIDLKTTVESNIESLDERLKRIEKIIDRLQLSIMQKVGDYMTNIEDIKKEIQETQKSFKSMSMPERKTEKMEKPKMQMPKDSATKQFSPSYQ